MQWIAISNHNAHSVLLYEYKLLLNNRRIQMAYYAVFIIHTVWHLLRMVVYPRCRCRFALCSYLREGCLRMARRWSPIYSSRVLSDEDFFRGRPAMAVQKVVRGVSILTIL